ncbi:MAG: hypothetical protein ACE5I7_06605 [Candidatus Binatia bacterium]
MRNLFYVVLVCCLLVLPSASFAQHGHFRGGHGHSFHHGFHHHSFGPFHFHGHPHFHGHFHGHGHAFYGHGHGSHHPYAAYYCPPAYYSGAHYPYYPYYGGIVYLSGAIIDRLFYDGDYREGYVRGFEDALEDRSEE